MKKTNIITACVFAGLLIAGSSLYQVMAQDRDSVNLEPVSENVMRQLKEKGPRQIPLRTVGRTDYFFEDFEETPEPLGTLPEGWVTSATAGNTDDTWQCGTLASNGNPINGASGWQYAYVLGRPDNKAHDTWLFSPAIHLSEGIHYLDFYTYMPPSVSGVKSVIEVSLCSSQSADSEISGIVTCDTPVDVWTKCVRSFSVDSEGDFVIGFRCSSPANANAMLLDNVRVSDGDNPLYGGYDTIEVGDVDVRVGKGSAETVVANSGNTPLRVSLKECSPEITVSGLPLEVEEFDEEVGFGIGTFKVTVNLDEPREYEGYVVLNTNDALHPEVRIKVLANGREYSVSNYISESFEYGLPTDWTISYMSFILKAYGAYDRANAWYASIGSNQQESSAATFTTNYVELGDNPAISFWYKAYGSTGAAQPEDVVIRVLANDDEGEWHEVYAMRPGASAVHNPVLDFQKIEFQLPEYAGQTRRFKFAFSTPKGCRGYDVLADEVKIGTCPDGDIALTMFEGPALLEAGEMATYRLTIINQGSEPLNYAALQLRDLKSDKILKRWECPGINGFDTYQFEFQTSFSQAGSYDLVMTATNWNDPNEDNNTSYPIHLSVVPEESVAQITDAGYDPFNSAVYPINFNCLETIGQTLYYANEIGIDKAQINSICYTSILNEPYLSDTISVYVAETDLEDFSGTTFIPEENFTKVFEGNVYFPAGRNTLVIPFSEPYDYKGRNLVIMTKRAANMFMYGVRYKNLRDNELRKRSIEVSSLIAGRVFGDDANWEPTTTATFPEMTVNMVKAPAGSLEGTITSEAGEPVAEAKVTVDGTSLSTVTDSEGKYLLPQVAAGDVKVKVSAHGYYTTISESVALATGNAATLNVKLKAYPLVSLKGKVTSDLDGSGIEGVAVKLAGYSSYIAYSDASGNYEVPGIAAGTDVPYAVSFEHPWFRSNVTSLDINANSSLDATLKVKPSHPNKVEAATDEETECTVSWNEPLVEYSHDSGVPSDFVGWNLGNAGVIAGTRFLRKAEIEEVSWYCSTTTTGHNNFNVIIFGLSPDGSVNPNNILYVAQDVEYTEDAWSTHRLTKKITADGFLVAISCDGFLSIGVCEPTEDTPFAVGQNYFAGVSFTYNIQEMSEWKQAHFMIRAYGKDKGDWSYGENSAQAVKADFAGKPVPEYNVYRFEPGTPQEDWTKIATVSDKTFADPEFSTLGKGTFSYAVTALYGSKESIPGIYAIVDKTTSAVIPVESNDIKVSLERGELVISDPSAIRSMEIYSLSGSRLASFGNPPARVDLSFAGHSVLVVRFTTSDGASHSLKVMR